MAKGCVLWPRGGCSRVGARLVVAAPAAISCQDLPRAPRAHLCHADGARAARQEPWAAAVHRPRCAASHRPHRRTRRRGDRDGDGHGLSSCGDRPAARRHRRRAVEHVVVCGITGESRHRDADWHACGRCFAPSATGRAMEASTARCSPWPALTARRAWHESGATSPHTRSELHAHHRWPRAAGSRAAPPSMPPSLRSGTARDAQG